jgi:demethylmenaquinone methyltransferase/2-methoxy-6-polyprenyl-1,4-benzoquinol methylase
MDERVQADASSLPFRTTRAISSKVAEPRSGIWRAGFRVWFRRVVPFIGSLVSDRAAYHYLPQSTAYLPTSAEIVHMLNHSGFAAVNHRRVMGGLSQQFIATRTS